VDKESNDRVVLQGLLCLLSSAISPLSVGLLSSAGIIQPVRITEIDGMCQNSANKHWFTFQMTAHFSQACAPFYLLFMKQIAFLHKCKLLLMSVPWCIWKECLFFLLLHGILFVVPLMCDFDPSPTADAHWSQQRQQKASRLGGCCMLCRFSFPCPPAQL